jgi:mRNA interferase RelE/StbE
VRDLNRLDRPVARRVVSKLEQAAAQPDRFFERLVGSSDYRLRIGDYRLFGVLAYESRTIIVERVDHRSRVHERRR